MNREWFAIRTQPRKEQIARKHYEQQDFIVYSPLVLTIRRHARRIDKVPRPLFPGYVFLHLSIEDRRWNTIGSTIGAIGPVRFGEYYPPVPDWVIEGLRVREDESGLISLGSQGSTFKQGDRVSVVLENLEYLEGIFQAARGEDRALILMEILHRQVSTLVPVWALKVA
ncbi:MAG: transcriptional activator RfaH [Thermodesulfobacteriota bacterium]|nr:transcriptional activator RfaH [Thermodesulfobacteriota bacterium]